MEQNCCAPCQQEAQPFCEIQDEGPCEGTRSQNWYSEARAQFVRKKARTQSLWNLHLAGDWHHSVETLPTGPRPHLMRCMLIANLAVDQRFANGTTGSFCKMGPYDTLIIVVYVLSFNAKVVSCSGTRVRQKTSAVLFLPTTLTFWPGSARSLPSRSERCCQI